MVSAVHHVHYCVDGKHVINKDKSVSVWCDGRTKHTPAMIDLFTARLNQCIDDRPSIIHMLGDTLK